MKYYLLIYSNVHLHIFGECSTTIVEKFFSEKDLKVRMSELVNKSGSPDNSGNIYKYKNFEKHCCIEES